MRREILIQKKPKKGHLNQNTLIAKSIRFTVVWVGVGWEVLSMLGSKH